ncbi:DUF1330 domain-containing protein [Streptomyces sp. TS71-3]|uniref:DUF1330 domain-containing protein n=1 Tax=Streptomyces sp. TS71-3 TaxID=2733862 RepID=UPI001B17A30A|nr:DUF1330 domain-containing protein [Streptomyces sp. TS71-3]GHJ35264.1 hypothetical protein Sm713_08730 [Streptomyces sp. TS71-3]
MTAYAVGHLRPGGPHEDVFRYIELIQSTLDPYRGRFLVHGASVEVKEGQWPGAIVIIAFPDLTAAREWYDSPAYREILPMRTDHMPGDVILVDGVPVDYDPSATAARLREAAA